MIRHIRRAFSNQKKSVCVIGAGPSGMSSLIHFAGKEDKVDVVCYDK